MQHEECVFRGAELYGPLRSSTIPDGRWGDMNCSLAVPCLIEHDVPGLCLVAEIFLVVHCKSYLSRTNMMQVRCLLLVSIQNYVQEKFLAGYHTLILYIRGRNRMQYQANVKK